MTTKTTLDFYNNNAEQFLKQTLNVDMQALYLPFIDSLPNLTPNNQTILDLGCGSGRDSYFFDRQGFKVTAIDGSQELIDLAKKLSYRENNTNWYCLNFSQLESLNRPHYFTGIWACASLLHLSYAQLPNFLNKLFDMTTTNGVIYASFKYGNSERITQDRFFCDLNEQRWEDIKNQLNKPINDTVWLTQDRRANRDDKWFNVLIKNV